MGQGDWCWCNKCQGLFYGGNDTRGKCPADNNEHSRAGSHNYTLEANNPSAKGQDDWRWCNKCQGLFYGGNDTRGKCPADNNEHSRAGSYNYTLQIMG